MPQNKRWIYDIDPSGEGFFCPQLIQKRNDYFALKQLRPAEAEAVYQCRPGAKVGSIFVEADFRYFDMPFGMDMGRNYPAMAKWIDDKNGILAQGWDTAMSAESQADYTACVTVLLVPCQEFHREQEASLLPECDQHYDVYVLDVFRVKMDIGDLVVAVREQAIKWRPDKIIIEKKASGASLMQALANSGLPIEGVSPQENKRDRAINGGAGAGSVQGWFKSGRVLFPLAVPPVVVPWLSELARELKDFTGEKGGIDDQVDALVHVVSYGIREGSLGVQFLSGWQSEEEVDAQMHSPEGLGRLFTGLASVEDLVRNGVVTDPFANRCGRCVHFRTANCPLKGKVSEIHSACESFDSGDVIMRLSSSLIDFEKTVN